MVLPPQIKLAKSLSKGCQKQRNSKVQIPTFYARSC
jgi:hypothetical protein